MPIKWKDFTNGREMFGHKIVNYLVQLFSNNPDSLDNKGSVLDFEGFLFSNNARGVRVKV